MNSNKILTPILAFLLVGMMNMATPTRAQIFEAENADMLTGVDAVADAGASGGFRVRNFDEIGDSIRFDGIPVGTAIEISYSLSRDYIRQCSLYINGIDELTLTFSPSSSWTNYYDRHFYFPISGSVELRIDADDRAANRNDAMASIDKIEIFQTVATSTKAFQDSNNRMRYEPFSDSYGDHYIVDYSNCGYGGGGRGILPDPTTIPVMATVSTPGAGMDAGPVIQAAIDSVSAMPLNDQGFRGAVLLQAGTYEIPGTISIAADGVVLRGVGDDADDTSNTILLGTGVDPGQRTLVTIAGSGFFAEVGGSSQDILDQYLSAGFRSFNVADASGFSPGDTVIVLFETPQVWIDEIGMNLLDNPWMPGERDLRFDRVITRIEGNRITVDAPMPNAFDQSIDGGGRIYRYTRAAAGRIRQSGIEFLRIDSESTSATDEDHMWNCVAFDDIEHGWARNITGVSYGFGVTRLLTGAKWISVVDCSALEPVSQVTGGRRYPFVLERGQLCFFRRCFSRSGRHDFVQQSSVPGPNAYVDCATQNSLNDTGPHQRWSAGVLYDNVRVFGHDFRIRDRQNSGTGHGWTGANQTGWNSRADNIVIEQPPTAQNWAIGCESPSITGDGFFESSGTPVSPTSLYDAQLNDRLEIVMPGANVYEEGTTPSFPELPTTPDSVISFQAPVDITTIGPSGDRTYNIVISDTGDINHLALRLDANSSNSMMNVEVKNVGGTSTASIPLPIDLAGFAVGYRAFCSFEIGTSSTDYHLKLIREDIHALVWEQKGTIVRTISGVLDQLSKNLGANATGSIGNVEVSLGIIHRFAAIEDASVSEAAANSNFGSNTSLTLKDEAADNWEAFLKFNVSGITGTPGVARLKLHSDTLFGSVRSHIVTDNSWNEGTITWNSKPAIGVTLDNEEALLPGTDMTIDVSAHVVGNGTWSFGLKNDSASVMNLDLASSESLTPGDQPILELIGEGTPLPVTLSGFNIE